MTVDESSMWLLSMMALSVRLSARSLLTLLTTLGREYREWAPGAANAEIEAAISEISDANDAVIFTDGSVKRGVKCGWAYSVRVDG